MKIFLAGLENFYSDFLSLPLVDFHQCLPIWGMEENFAEMCNCACYQGLSEQFSGSQGAFGTNVRAKQEHGCLITPLSRY
jgi:hypothetical protein